MISVSSVLDKLVIPRNTCVCKFLHTSVPPMFTLTFFNAKSPHNFTSMTSLPSAIQISVRFQFLFSYIGVTYKYRCSCKIGTLLTCHSYGASCHRHVSSYTTKLILDEWQEVWNCCAGNKLHAIRPTAFYKQKTLSIAPWYTYTVLLNRLRIGHTRLTHSYLLSGDDLPECGTCQCPLTVKHILVDCVDLKDVRNKHFVASSIKDLFDSIEAHKIIDFIKETHLYKQL